MKRTKRKLIDEIKERADARYEDARFYVNQKRDAWLTRASFYRGNQYTLEDAVSWFDLDNPVGEAREVFNYVSAFVRAAVAYRAKSFPNPEVPAANGDVRSIARAEATEKLLKHFVDDNVVDKGEFNRALTWAQIGGGAWVKCYWDPNRGKPLLEENTIFKTAEPNPETGEIEEFSEAEEDPFGNPVVSREYEGEIVTEFVDTFDGMPDPTAKRLSEMRYFIHRKLRPVGELESFFPKDIFGESTEGRFVNQPRDATVSERDYVVGTEEGYTGSDIIKAHDKDSVKCELVEYWEKPCPDYPNGILMVYSGPVVLHCDAIPYRPARLPVVLFLGDNIVPSALYADGVVENLIAPQRTLNRYATKKREWVDKILNPHVLNPLGSNVDPDQFGEVCGQIISHTPGLVPKIMDVPNIPNSLFEAEEQLISRMKDISTYSDISRGEAPKGVESGRAIAFLSEHEQTIREPDMILHRQACLDLLQHCLYLSKQYYQNGRLMKVGGDEGWEMVEFKDDDYDWYLDLAPEAFSGAPNSRALRWSETMEAFQNGLFNDSIPGAKTARKILSLDYASKSTIDESKQAKNVARMENLQSLRGEPIYPVKPWQDDEVHLDEHNRFRNSLDYMNMAPALQQTMDAHCEEHEMQLQQKMALHAGQPGQAPPGPPPEEAAPPNPAPMNGGHSIGEPMPPTSAEYVQTQQQNGIFPS